MDWKQTLAATRKLLSGLKLEEGAKLADVKHGEGDDAKSLADLLGSLETELKAGATSADGNAAAVVKLTNERDSLIVERDALAEKVGAAGDIDKRVSTAESKETKATERAIAAEGKLRDLSIRGAARDALDDAGLAPGQKKTALALLMFDLDGVEVDDAGTVSGLAKRMESVKADHPAVWAKQTNAGPAGDGGGDAGGTGDTGAGSGAADGTGGGESKGDDARAESQLMAALGIKDTSTGAGTGAGAAA